MNKAQLRRQSLTQRRSLTEEDFNDKNQKLIAQFLNQVPLDNHHYLHTFLPIEKNREVNTFLLIKALRNNYPHLTIVVPKTSDDQMRHYILAPDAELIPGPFDVPEPTEALPIAEEKIEIVLVPLLAFDLDGHRLGYGKGYYDRFLSKCNRTVFKVGLSLLPPIEQILERSNHDIPMDAVVTPDRIYHFDTSTTA